MREEFAPEAPRRTMDSVTAERFWNTYHNAGPHPAPDVPEDLASFMLAAEAAARVLAQAGDREVVVTRTVRDLVTGTDLAFSPLGAVGLRGIPGEWELFAASAG
jgi:hypothetical protein